MGVFEGAEPLQLRRQSVTQKESGIASGLFLSHSPGSNWRPARYECAALPTELKWPLTDVKASGMQRYTFFSILRNFQKRFPIREAILPAAGSRPVPAGAVAGFRRHTTGPRYGTKSPLP